MGRFKTKRAVRLYRVQSRIETDSENFQLFIAADERAIAFLRQMMQEHPVIFVYRKEDNEITRRTGTLQMNYIKERYTFKKGEDATYKDPRKLRYWDIGRNYWRTAEAERLIGYFDGPPPSLPEEQEQEQE